MKSALLHSNVQPGLRIAVTERRWVGDGAGGQSTGRKGNLSREEDTPRGRTLGCSLQPRFPRASSLGQWLSRQTQVSYRQVHQRGHWKEGD